MIKNREPNKIDSYGQYWYDDDGKYHNDNGYSAYIGFDKIWYKHGKLHNENGPAYIGSDGYKAWYIDDVKYTEEEFKQYKIKNFIYNDIE